MYSRIIILVLLFSTPALADESTQPTFATTTNFTLTVDQNGPGSDALLRGAYDDAIATAEQAVRVNPNLSGYLTLCVAYIRSDELDNAQLACDEAVAAARAPITTTRNPYGHANRDGLASAYLNRGVLLSLTGNPDAARTDFAVALRQNRQSNMVRHNMRVNEASVRTASNP